MVEVVKGMLFDSVLRVLFGTAFVRHHGRERLHKFFFEFEEDFEVYTYSVSSPQYIHLSCASPL